MIIAPARPAATVVVVRDMPADAMSSDTSAACDYQVLLVRRNDQVAFMAGAFVFPGGRIDEADRVAAGGDETLAFRLGAVRELAEEAGVRVEPGTLLRFAHWVTPDSESRRYDTHFFLVRMPANQVAVHDAGETTALVWLTPEAAIARAIAGEMQLPPPTWTTLARMRQQRTLAALFTWAASVPVPRVQPKLVREEHGATIYLPGDPLFPTIEGWEIPEHTRFLLWDRGWQAVHATERRTKG